MFPPNNPHHPRNRSCTRCLNGTKRKGLYAVFTIGVFLCIIFAVTLMYEHHVLDVSKQHVLGTMHQSYNAESLKFVDESRRRMPGPESEEKSRAALYGQFKSVLREHFIMYDLSGKPITPEDPKWGPKAYLAFENLLQYCKREKIKFSTDEAMDARISQFDSKEFRLTPRKADRPHDHPQRIEHEKWWNQIITAMQKEIENGKMVIETCDLSVMHVEPWTKDQKNDAFQEWKDLEDSKYTKYTGDPFQLPHSIRDYSFITSIEDMETEARTSFKKRIVDSKNREDHGVIIHFAYTTDGKGWSEGDLREQLQYS